MSENIDEYTLPSFFPPTPLRFLFSNVPEPISEIKTETDEKGSQSAEKVKEHCLPCDRIAMSFFLKSRSYWIQRT
jgi:hypothetical protein